MIDSIYEKTRSKITNMLKIIATSESKRKRYSLGYLYLTYMVYFVEHNKIKFSYCKQKLDLHKNNKVTLISDVQSHIDHVKNTLEHLLIPHDAVSLYEIHLAYMDYLSGQFNLIHKGVKEFCEKNKSHKYIKFIRKFNDNIFGKKI